MTNIVILAGNIGQAPETRNTRNGTTVTTFTLATSKPVYANNAIVRDDRGFIVKNTEWHRIVTFNGLSKTVMEHCTKGMKVLVRGELHYTKWQDKDGIERYGCEIIADKVEFLSRATKADEAGGNGEPGVTEDIPF